MTTLPPEPRPLSEPDTRESHQVREVAESFGRDAGRYDRARPSYPSALVDRVIAESPGTDVLDVGCGTGIVARLFQAAGCTVLGVDPDERMADQARQRGLPVEVARFEDWDPAGREFDLVVAGQAFHWIDPVAGAAKAARALRPGGRLAAFWNSFQPPADLGEQFAEVYRRAAPDSPVFRRPLPGPEAYAGFCGKVADAIAEAGGFGAAEQWRFDWDRPYTRDEWLDQIPTFGFQDKLPPATLQEILANVGTVIDAIGGSFTMHYATMVVTAARAGR
jgi:SAM-dependent methyltransferase